jgi:hypothetical protein
VVDLKPFCCRDLFGAINREQYRKRKKKGDESQRGRKIENRERGLGLSFSIYKNPTTLSLCFVSFDPMLFSLSPILPFCLPWKPPQID